MKLSSSSSGDLLADRRYGVGLALAADGDHGAAADLFEQTLELAPDWAPGWLALGLARERQGLDAAALAALRRADALDPEGRLGASLHLARLGGGPAPAMPPAFVRELFDGYADRFDTHLVETLNYRGPAVIANALRRVPAMQFEAVLDLGCGTGLMARALNGHAAAIDGVDLAPRMIARAARTGLYRTLAVGEIEPYLRDAAPARWDLVVAADVLVYLGAITTLFAAMVRVLRPGGYVAFTVQALADGGDYRLGEDMRFSHRQAYIEDAVAASGLTTALIEPTSTRTDRGNPVPGLVVVATKP